MVKFAAENLQTELSLLLDSELVPDTRTMKVVQSPKRRLALKRRSNLSSIYLFYVTFLC